MQHALELLLTGDRIDAARAQEIGLAWKVVPRADLLVEARRLADRLCQGAPLAVRAVKEMAYRGAHVAWVDAVRMGEAMRRVVAATDDAARAWQPRPSGARRAGAAARACQASTSRPWR